MCDTSENKKNSYFIHGISKFLDRAITGAGGGELEFSLE